MKHLKLLTLALFVCSVSMFTAQEQTPAKVKEVGIGFTSLNNFSLQYRWGTEKKLYRVSGYFGGNSGFGNSTYDYKWTDTTFKPGTVKGTNKSPVDLNLGLNFSVLKLKPGANKLGFFYGPTIGVFGNYNNGSTSSPQYTINTSTFSGFDSKSTTINSGISLGLTLGLMYKINSDFYLYGEITPSVFFNNYYQKSSNTMYYNNSTASYTTDQTSSNNRFGLSGISNSGAMFTLGYRIGN